MVFKRKKLKYIFQLNWKCQLMKKGMIIEWNISRIILHFLYHADHLQDTIIIYMYQVVCTVVFVYISSSNLDTQYWKKIVHVFEREILDFSFLNEFSIFDPHLSIDIWRLCYHNMYH